MYSWAIRGRGRHRIRTFLLLFLFFLFPEELDQLLTMRYAANPKWLSWIELKIQNSDRSVASIIESSLYVCLYSTYIHTALHDFIATVSYPIDWFLNANYYLLLLLGNDEKSINYWVLDQSHRRYHSSFISVHHTTDSKECQARYQARFQRFFYRPLCLVVGESQGCIITICVLSETTFKRSSRSVHGYIHIHTTSIP